MGQCATSVEEPNHAPQNDGPSVTIRKDPAVPSIPTSPPKPTANNTANNNTTSSSPIANGRPTSHSAAADADGDFRDTAKLLSLLILDRIVTILDGERDGYTKVAHKLGKANFLDIIAPHHFEKFLRDYFPMTGREPPVPKDHIQYKAKKFLIAIQDAQDNDYRDPKPNRVELAKRLVEATKATRNELLLAVNACDNAHLRQYLQFFAKAMEYAATDELVHHPSKIHEAVDELTRQ